MGRQLFTNNASTTLSGTLAQGGTTLVMSSGTGNKFPSISGTDYFYVTVFTKDVSGEEQNVEVMKVTARVGDTCTVVRDIESITGQAGGFAFNGASETVYIHERWTAGSAENQLQTGDIGTTVQGHSATLDTLANTTAAGLALMDDADAAAQRATLGLGGAATKDVGTGSTQVAQGNHTHPGVYEPADVGIQNHIASKTNPHDVTATQVGLGNAENKTFATGTADATHAATSKATPVDADEIPLVDSAAANVLKKLTWANLKATLKMYFDGLYQAAGSYLTSSAIGTTVQAYSANLTAWAALATSAKQDPIGTISGMVKGNGANTLTAATAGTDYVAPGTATVFTKPQTASTSSETAPSSNTVTWDLTANQIFRINLNASITTFNLTGTLANLSGLTLMCIVRYNGGSAITWPAAVKWTAATAPTLTGTSGKCDIFTFVVATTDGTNYYLENTGIKQNVG